MGKYCSGGSHTLRIRTDTKCSFDHERQATCSFCLRFMHAPSFWQVLQSKLRTLEFALEQELSGSHSLQRGRLALQSMPQLKDSTNLLGVRPPETILQTPASKRQRILGAFRMEEQRTAAIRFVSNGDWNSCSIAIAILAKYKKKMEDKIGFIVQKTFFRLNFTWTNTQCHLI